MSALGHCYFSAYKQHIHLPRRCEASKDDLDFISSFIFLWCIVADTAVCVPDSEGLLPQLSTGQAGGGGRPHRRTCGLGQQVLM